VRARELTGFLAIDIPVSMLFHAGYKSRQLGCRHKKCDWRLLRRRPSFAVVRKQCIAHAHSRDSCLET